MQAGKVGTAQSQSVSCQTQLVLHGRALLYAQVRWPGKAGVTHGEVQRLAVRRFEVRLCAALAAVHGWQACLHSNCDLRIINF
jgi:hypothetical protein